MSVVDVDDMALEVELSNKYAFFFHCYIFWLNASLEKWSLFRITFHLFLLASLGYFLF